MQKGRRALPTRRSPSVPLSLYLLPLSPSALYPFASYCLTLSPCFRSGKKELPHMRGEIQPVFFSYHKSKRICRSLVVVSSNTPLLEHLKGGYQTRRFSLVPLLSLRQEVTFFSRDTVMPKVTLLKLLLVFVLLRSANVQELESRSEDASCSCKRIVIEKPRCLIYNYNDPNCKKWDHSNCPPPRIHKETSRCVSYKCTRLFLEWENPRPRVTPAVARVTNTTNTTTLNSPNLEEERPTFEKDLRDLQTELNSLKTAQANDVQYLEAERDGVKQELENIRDILLSYSDRVKQLEENIENTQVPEESVEDNEALIWERLHQQEATLQTNLQNLEEKLFHTNSSIFGRLFNLESQISDLQNLVHRLHLHQPASESVVCGYFLCQNNHYILSCIFQEHLTHIQADFGANSTGLPERLVNITRTERKLLRKIRRLKK